VYNHFCSILNCKSEFNNTDVVVVDQAVDMEQYLKKERDYDVD